MKIILTILTFISIFSSYGCSLPDRKPIVLDYKGADYYKQKRFTLLESKIFSIFLPSEIDLNKVLSFNETGKETPFSKDDIKNQTYMHIKSSEKSHYEIDKFEIDNPTMICYQYRLILRKENGVRICFLGKGPRAYDNVFIIDNIYCIQDIIDRGYYIFTFINENIGEVVEMFLSARLDISDKEIEDMISSIQFKDTNIKRQIIIKDFGTLKELDEMKSIE